MEITIQTKIAQVPEQISTQVDGQTALLSIENGAYYGFDPVGSRIWELIAGPREVKEVVDLLVTEYEVERERCEREVLAFLRGLAQRNLVRIV